jgi:hypothetical protein
MHIFFRAYQAMQQFGQKELGQGIPNTTMHALQSSQGKMQVFKMHLLGCQTTLDGDDAF